MNTEHQKQNATCAILHLDFRVPRSNRSRKIRNFPFVVVSPSLITFPQSTVHTPTDPTLYSKWVTQAMSPCKFYLATLAILGGRYTDGGRIRLSYNDVHKAIQSSAIKIKEEFGKSFP